MGADVCLEPIVDVRDRVRPRASHSHLIRLIGAVDAATTGR